jgi:hypothetical protein
MSKTIREVFRKPLYLAVAAAVAFLIFSLAIWLRNFPFLGEVIVSPAFTIPDKILLFVRFLGGIATNVTAFSAALIIVMSVLFGINASLILYYLVKRRDIPKKEGVGAAGAFASGLLGVGCASCGTFLLGATLASFGTSGLITLLPLRGEEFSILAIVLLGLSIYWISKSIQSTKICAV